MFWSGPMVEDDLLAWIEENFDWVLDHRPAWWDIAQLILPTRDFFAAPGGQSHETAGAILKDVTRLLGVEQDFQLEPIGELRPEHSHSYQQMGSVAGQYLHDVSAPLIRYSPNLMAQPHAFINAMAHEVMHARLADVVDELPGGREAHELATDLHCIIAGFGLFQLNAAEQIGWAGYMTQPSRAVSLAIFLDRKGIDREQALSRLGPRSAKYLRKATRELAR